MDQRAEELVTRAVVALEALAEEPELEIPTSPPLCPHCGFLDPVVIDARETGGQGKMSAMFLDLQCTNCQGQFYVVPQGWVNFTEMKELREFFERAENGYSREDN